MAISDQSPVTTALTKSQELVPTLRARAAEVEQLREVPKDRPNVYRPAPQLLQAFGVQTLEELRDGIGISKPPGFADLWVAEDDPEAVGNDQVGTSEDDVVVANAEQIG